MPLEWPFVPRISEPRARMREYERPMPPHVLRQARDLVVAVVDRVELVQRGVQQVAGGHLRVPGAGVEERGGGRQVVEAAHQPVEGGHFLDGLDSVVLGEATGHAEHEVLRGLDDLAGDRVAQQVAAVQGAQAEEAEAVVGALGEGVLDQCVQAARVQRHELGGAVRDQALAVADRDGGGEGGGPLARGFLGDGQRQQPGGEPGERRVLGDETGGGLRGQPAQFGLVGGGAAPAERGGGDPARVGVGEVGGQLGEGTQQCGPRSPGLDSGVGRVGLGARCGRRDGHGGALPRSAPGHLRCGRERARAGQGLAGHAHTARRPPAQPRGPDVSAPGSVEPGALSAGPRTCGDTNGCTSYRCGTVPDSHRIPLRRQRA